MLQPLHRRKWFNAAGNIVLVENGNRRVQVLRYSDGAHVRTIGSGLQADIRTKEVQLTEVRTENKAQASEIRAKDAEISRLRADKDTSGGVASPLMIGAACAAAPVSSGGHCMAIRPNVRWDELLSEITSRVVPQVQSLIARMQERHAREDALASIHEDHREADRGAEYKGAACTHARSINIGQDTVVTPVVTWRSMRTQVPA